MADTSVTSLEKAISLVPSIGGKVAAPHLSARYRVADTAEIVSELETLGWELAAVTSKARNKTPSEVTKHGLRMSLPAPKAPSALVKAYAMPQLVLQNSHDGTSALNIRAGLYTFACANQAVVGDTLAYIRILHRDYTRELLLDSVSDMMRRLPAVFDEVERWKGIQLASEQAREYNTAAMALRFNANDLTHQLRTFARTRRVEDQGLSLYAVYQKAQESLLRGGDRVDVVNPRTLRVENRRTRPVSAIAANVRLNTRLWDLTTQTAAQVGAN